MKKILFLLFSILMVSVFSYAGEDGPNKESSSTIKLEISKKGDNVKPHRTSINLNISACYNRNIQSIEITYYGETEGEAYLYLGNDMIGYSNEINTTFQLPNQHGTYSIEIITESWTAHGAIEL